MEHPLGVNKSASALLGAGLLWTLYALSTGDHALVGHQLNESLATTAQIVFFLMGAMTIVEVVDGLASAIVDNVPLVAASMGMFSLTEFPTDSYLWQLMAYAAGTGGSILIIGSAAGVAAMGLEKIHFFWYVKRISGLALIGYFSGLIVYIVQYKLCH